MKETYPGDSDSDHQALPGLDPSGVDDASFVPEPDGELWMRRAEDERTRQIGGNDVVAWIAEGTRPGRTITSAIPPVFTAYATVIVPDGDDHRRASDEALLTLLHEHAGRQPWWLGYLETGVADLVFPSAPRVSLYAGWPYVVVKAGYDEAATWRTDDDATPWHSALPELMFPLDHSWLVSTLWDDDWRCIGGPTSLVDAVPRHPLLDARAVALGEDATPPGHEAL